MLACTLGLVKWMTVSSLKMFTSSMPGMVLTPRRFSVFCRRLSSWPLDLCTAFFLLLHAQAHSAVRQRVARPTAGLGLARRDSPRRRQRLGSCAATAQRRGTQRPRTGARSPCRRCGRRWPWLPAFPGSWLRTPADSRRHSRHAARQRAVRRRAARGGGLAARAKRRRHNPKAGRTRSGGAPQAGRNAPCCSAARCQQSPALAPPCNGPDAPGRSVE